MPWPPVETNERRWRWCDLWVTLAGLLGLLAWDASGLDLAVDLTVGGPSGFPWRRHWLTASVLHQGGRWLAAAVLIGLLLNAVWPLGKAMRQIPRADRLWWLLVSGVCLLLPALIKPMSLSSCPWDLQVFGGHAAWVSHWQWGVRDGGPGHCFPSGHAAAAFGFLPGWFVLRERLPAVARRWLAAVLGLGLLYAAAQLLRGAHYVSHSAWTAWLCWTLSAVAHHAWHLRRAKAGGHPPPPVVA